MPQPTKADLETAVEKLTREKAGLLELIAAIGDVAMVPMYVNPGERDMWLDAQRTVAIRVAATCQRHAEASFDPALSARVLREMTARDITAYEREAPKRRSPRRTAARSTTRPRP